MSHEKPTRITVAKTDVPELVEITFFSASLPPEGATVKMPASDVGAWISDWISGGPASIDPPTVLEAAQRAAL